MAYLLLGDIVLAVSLNQFRVNQPNVASGILEGKQNVWRTNSFTGVQISYLSSENLLQLRAQSCCSAYCYNFYVKI